MIELLSYIFIVIQKKRVIKMSDTIAAISTALGEGGIGIVRISGPRSLEIMREIFAECPEIVKPRYAYFGHIVEDNSELIDEAIFLYMIGPASYTGEDMLEIQAHGSNVSLRKILRETIHKGARLAEPGEYTKLAFLNGKMDLSQAEAVIDIIKAKTEYSLEIAESQLKGRLGRTVSTIRAEILDVLAQMAVNIDYPDEDIEQESYDSYIDTLRLNLSDCKELLDTAGIGKISRDGIKIAIVGKPNVGKSSLMNALLGEGRVIVTDIPGTTRDTVEESANIDGIPIVLIDTAGIRDTEDTVERIGIEKTKDALNNSDMAIFVIDGSMKLDEEDEEIIYLLNNARKGRSIVVINKEDVGTVISEEDLRARLPESTIITTTLVGFGAISGARSISDAIAEFFKMGSINPSENSIVTSERHVHLLESACDNIEQAIYMLEEGTALELVELNVRYAYEELGQIIGEAVGDEILDTVFSKFCLGK